MRTWSVLLKEELKYAQVIKFTSESEIKKSSLLPVLKYSILYSIISLEILYLLYIKCDVIAYKQQLKVIYIFNVIFYDIIIFVNNWKKSDCHPPPQYNIFYIYYSY